MERSKARVDRGTAALLGVAGGLFVASAALLGAYVFAGGQVPAASIGAGSQEPAEPSTPDDAALAAVHDAARALIATPVTLSLGESEAQRTWAKLGIVVDEAALPKVATALGDTPPTPAALMALAKKDVRVPVKIDRERAIDALLALKPVFDRAPASARLDLEDQHIYPAEPGYGIDVYASVSAIEMAARGGRAEVTLSGAEIPPAITIEDLGISDISHVLGRFRTKFRVRGSTRNDNLKLGGSRLNGFVLQPGELFSFNEIVGERSKERGYKIAHVITQGQLVDGLAGGMCQISTTLHAAAFFAGLEIVRSRPHSRPSTYVAMGLDATVVYPYVDLKLRNPYDFPVAFRYRVARGESIVEILGKERPYDRVVFERIIKEQKPFDTVTREDGDLPIGSMVIDQAGFPGYILERYRKFYKDGELVKRDRWKLRYSPVTEYVRMGVNPDPNLMPPKAKGRHGPKPPKKKRFVMSQ